LHVDDLLMAHSHVQLREQFMRDNPYKIKDLGAVSSIIGADIHQNLVEGFVKFSLSTYTSSLRPVVLTSRPLGVICRPPRSLSPRAVSRLTIANLRSAL
jgi:hypothetical protein